MQNRFLLLALLFFFPSLLQAQTFIGFNAGISQSKTRLNFNVASTEIARRGDLLGLAIGIPLELKLNDVVRLQPELLFATEGALLSVLRPEEQRTYHNILYYLKIPILVKVLVLKEKNYQVGLLAGFTPAYAIGIKSFSFSFFNPLRLSTTESISFATANINRFDLALSAGASVEKTIAQGIKMALTARYNMGVYNISQEVTRSSFTESLQLTLGLWMPLKRKGKKG